MFKYRSIRVAAACVAFFCVSDAFGAAGNTPGSFSVSAGGAATYTIPIRVPSGPRGVSPNLSLQYNSQAENGVVGVGWSLSGLPSIERCAKTVGQDGVAAAVGLTMSDRFCLNGNRLQVTSADSSYGLDGATYQTEIADFSLITSYGASGNGPAYFTARSKEGLTYEYGLTTDSRVFPMSATTPLRWKLDKISDRDGNALLTVTYNNANGHAVPSKISWAPTSAGSTSYLYSAEFAYSSTRTDKDSQLGFVAGFRVENRSLLTGITIKSAAGGTARTVKRYVLTPEPAPQTGLTRLKQIQECADDAASDCLTPTVFGYQNGQNVNATVRAGASSSGTVSEAFFDLNGDGRQDVIYTASGTRYVLLANATGYSPPIAAPTASTYVVDRFMPGPADGFLIDVGGTWWYYTLNGTSFSGQATNAPVPSAITRLVADVNGDGLMDLVWMDSSYNVYIRLNVSVPASTVPTFSTTATFAIQLSGTNAFGTWHAGALYARQTGFGLRRLDVDGDGKQDLAAVAVVPPTGVGPPSIYALSLVSNGTALSLGTGSWAPVQANVGVNFNGDACTDRLAGTTVYVAKCKDTSDTTVSVPGTAVLTMDWDRDGKTDVLVNNGGTLGVYRSTGTGFSALESTAIPYSSTSTYLATDQDGDGTEDILKVDNAAPYAISFFTRNSSGSLPAFVLNVPDLLTTVTDGYGVVDTIGYVSTAQSNYSPGSTQTQLPLQDVANPIIVVGQVTISDGIGGSYSKRYTYAGARLNKDRQSSAGFERITEFDLRTPFSVNTYFDQLFPLAGMMSERSTYQPNGTTLVSKIKNTNSSVALDSGVGRQRFFVYVSNSVADTFTVDGTHLGDPLARVDSTFEYSGNNATYGNLSGFTRIAKDMRSQETWTTTFTNTYQPVDTTNWCIGLPYSIKREQSHAGSTVVTLSARFVEDDPLKCRNRTRTDAPDDPKYKVTTEFGFDSFSNVNRLTVTGTNPDGSAMTSRVTAVDWGTYGIYPSTLTNALNEVTRIDYNFDYGAPKTLWDPNSTATRELKTEWKYDTFGRLKQELRPDQTRLDVTYAACSGACVNTRHQTTVTATDSTANGVTLSQQITYLDQFERPIVVRTKLPESTGLYQWRETQYDSRGRVDKQNIPCATSSATGSCTAYWVQNRFDDFGRILESGAPRSETDSTPAKTIVSYDGLTRTITDALGSPKTHTYDVNGWLRTSQDANGYQQVFDYDPAGSLISVTDSTTTLFWAHYDYGAGVFQTASFDSGSKNSIDYASAPNSSRTYNSLGEVVQWSDSKGKLFSAQYDLLSRLKKIIEPAATGAPGTTFDWIWGNDSNATNIGRLQSVSSTQSSSVYSEVYTYDSLGRPYTTTINIPGDGAYAYDYRYDSDLGLLQTLEYPTTTAGYRLKLQFDYLCGTLNSIKDAQTSASYWKMDAINARAQVTQETLGNGIITKSTIDQVNGRLGKLLSGTTADETSVQNSGFLYDPAGNVTQRQQNRRLLTEDFHYDTNPNDQLQRLDSVQVRTGTNVTQNLGLDYYPDGRIKTRTDLTDTAPVDYTVIWDSGNYPVSITAGTQVVQFAYGPGRQRWKTQYQDSAASRSETTYYIGPFLEKVVTSAGTRYRHTIPTGAGAVALYERSSAGQVLRYAYTDHQGSIDAITNASGAVTALASFTAFGTRRSATDWVSRISDSERNSLEQITLQGYTYQTALGSMGLNHMNGRVQDALSGTFLSPDPFVPDATNTQDFNRYAYVRNNPLTLTDPSGFDPPSAPRPPSSSPTPLWNCYTDQSPFGPGQYVPGTTNADGTSSTAFVMPLMQAYATSVQCYGGFASSVPSDRHMSTADTMVGGVPAEAPEQSFMWHLFALNFFKCMADDGLPQFRCTPEQWRGATRDYALVYMVPGGLKGAGGLSRLSSVGRGLLFRSSLMLRGFTAAESALALEARGILNSSEFAAIRAAQAEGRSLTVTIGGRLIQYEPGFTYGQAMTLGQLNGFILGPRAFASNLELARTLAQELFRLRSGTLGYAEAGAYASEATQAAFQFAQRVGDYILGP